MKNFYFSLIFYFSFLKIFSQAEVLHCGADEMRINTLKQNPAIAAAVIKRDQQLENFTKSFSPISVAKTTTISASYIIPVVFHVIHNYGNENISDAQIKDGLDWVNKTFRKQRPDTASMVAAFKPIHADCDIEFRLATKDPNGNCHSGINRIASPLTSSGDHRVKNLIHWPPTQYLNVYVVVNAAGLAGHCVWPSDADTIPLWDGIVIGHNYVGTFGTSNLTQSVAFAHECGHYLNLQHIWGGNNVPGFYFYPCADPNKDCNIDDLVADTPPTIGWQSCNLNGASCGNVKDNVQNVMDYSYCNVMFTQGQKTRMQACLNSPIAGRNNLWQTANLIATGVYTPATVCAADFMSNRTVSCPNTQIYFSNTSFHGPFSSVEWKFAGGTPSVSAIANPTVSYATPGVYSIELKVKNGNDSAVVVKPNYIIIQNTTATGIGYPFSESFESTMSLNGTDWFRNNLDTSTSWQLTNIAAFSGSTSVMLDNFNSNIEGKDELFSKPINLTGATALNIGFKYAFARRDTSNKDQLQLFAYQNCSGTAIQRFSAIGAALETTSLTTIPFYPSGSMEWKSVSASLLPLFFNSTFRFKFVFSHHGGNNLFIDDINIDVTTGLNDISEVINWESLYPNPTNEHSVLKFTNSLSKTLSVSIYNTLGEKVSVLEKQFFEAGEHELEIQIDNLKSGLYLVELSDGLRSVNKRLVVAK